MLYAVEAFPAIRIRRFVLLRESLKLSKLGSLLEQGQRTYRVCFVQSAADIGHDSHGIAIGCLVNLWLPAFDSSPTTRGSRKEGDYQQQTVADQIDQTRPATDGRR
jgi:hypothetical protein